MKKKLKERVQTCVFIHTKKLYSQNLNIHIFTKVDIKINTTREYRDYI